MFEDNSYGNNIKLMQKAKPLLKRILSIIGRIAWRFKPLNCMVNALISNHPRIKSQLITILHAPEAGHWRSSNATSSKNDASDGADGGDIISSFTLMDAVKTSLINDNDENSVKYV